MLVQLSKMISLFAVLVPAYFLVIPGDRPCEWGKYGKHCNVTCPQNCATVPPSNLQHCQRDTGKCSAGCRRGWHGDRCDQSCSRNCLHNICNLQTGHCTIGCNGTFIGDFCNMTRECGRGWYGDMCGHPCSSNCVEQTCNQTTGVCALGCNSTYTGDFCNITTADNIQEDDNLAAILVVIAVVVAVVVVVAVILALRRRRRRRKNSAQNEHASYKSQALLSPGHEDEEGAEVEVTTPLQTGIMSEDLLQQTMEYAETVFKKTDIYNKVKRELETHRHVTMSGSAGAGKTAIALKLGKQYQDKGFTVFFVTDVCKINLSECLAGKEKVCVIFHDVFKMVELPRDKPQVERILHELEQELKKCKTSIGDKRELYAIFTANTNKVKGEMSEFGNLLYVRSSFINFNLKSSQYSRKEKKEIFNTYCKSVDLSYLDLPRICTVEQSVLGFPQTCKLFSAYANFQKYREVFFHTSFRYLREELEAILHRMNDESGALILMFLCKDTLNLPELEEPYDNQELENMFRLITDVVHISSRTKIAHSIRHFSGTFFTKGDITGFAHPSIYDACACALFSLNPSFVLEHCHMKFLREHVRPDQHLETSTVDENQPSIHVSDVYTGIVNRRRGRTPFDSHSEEPPNEMVSIDGVMNRDWLDKELLKTEEVFVETAIYRTVKKTLKSHGHVTMCGVAGSGKTAIALMLGKRYEEEQGFLQVHIADVSKLKLGVYLHEPSHRSVCFVFHDIFRIIERSKDIAVLQSVLGQLLKCKKETQKHKLYIIFTANTNSYHDDISQLGIEGWEFFNGQSFVDFNKMSCQYTPEEKKLIFDKLCKGVDTTVDVEKICKVEQCTLGFPQTCKLFVGFQSFQSHAEDFFHRPFHYLKEKICSILEGGDNQSAALILMFCCDGPLNLHQVDLPSDNKDLEDMLTTVKDMLRFTTRTGVAMAVRQFRGSFFTKGDITAFAHPTIYDACAIALYQEHRVLVLRYASIRFLCEHVYTDETQDTVPETKIYVHRIYMDVLRSRLSSLDKQHPNYKDVQNLISRRC